MPRGNSRCLWLQPGELPRPQPQRGPDGGGDGGGGFISKRETPQSGKDEDVTPVG